MELHTFPRQRPEAGHRPGLSVTLRFDAVHFREDCAELARREDGTPCPIDATRADFPGMSDCDWMCVQHDLDVRRCLMAHKADSFWDLPAAQQERLDLMASAFLCEDDELDTLLSHVADADLVARVKDLNRKWTAAATVPGSAS